MQSPTDNSTLCITASVQRFAGGGIGDVSQSVAAASLAAMGGQGRPAVSPFGKARCWPMDSSYKIAHPATILPYAERAPSIRAFQPINANSTGSVWDLAAKTVADPRAQGRAA